MISIAVMRTPMQALKNQKPTHSLSGVETGGLPPSWICGRRRGRMRVFGTDGDGNPIYVPDTIIDDHGDPMLPPPSSPAPYLPPPVATPTNSYYAPTSYTAPAPGDPMPEFGAVAPPPPAPVKKGGGGGLLALALAAVGVLR